MRSRFLTYLAHTGLRWKSEQEREALVDFAEQNLPNLVRLAGKDCQDGELYTQLNASFWSSLNSDLLPQSTPDEKDNMVKTMEALRFWLGFLTSKYPSMNHKEFEKLLAKERKKAQQKAAAEKAQQSETAEDPETEGKIIQQLSNERQRSRSLRKRVIGIFGTKCVACSLDMKSVYGQGAEGYIEVHHLNPISNFDEEHQITDDDIRDEQRGLRPLCPNCHTMIHKLGENWKTPMPLSEFIRLYKEINGQ